MKIEFRLLNCFLLILPLLFWNLILGRRMSDPRITSDAHSPRWLLIAENVTRIVVFTMPLFMPLPGKTDWEPASYQVGMVIYLLGTLLYFASWLPLLLAPGSAWSNSPAGLLAPRLTPFLTFLGIALIGDSWSYGLISAVFIFLHTWHGFQNISASFVSK